VVRRIASFATGWIPWGDEMIDPAAAVPRLRDSLAELGRDPRELRVQGGLRLTEGRDGKLDLDRTMEQVPSNLEAGITDFTLAGKMPRSAAEGADALPAVVEAFRAAAGA
jgi:hypothetical protein